MKGNKKGMAIIMTFHTPQIDHQHHITDCIHHDKKISKKKLGGTPLKDTTVQKQLSLERESHPFVFLKEGFLVRWKEDLGRGISLVKGIFSQEKEKIREGQNIKDDNTIVNPAIAVKEEKSILTKAEKGIKLDPLEQKSFHERQTEEGKESISTWRLLKSIKKAKNRNNKEEKEDLEIENGKIKKFQGDSSHLLYSYNKTGDHSILGVEKERCYLEEGRKGQKIRLKG